MASNLPPEVNEMLTSLTIKIILLMVGLAVLKAIISWFKSPKRKGKRGEGLGVALGRSVSCELWKVEYVKGVELWKKL